MKSRALAPPRSWGPSEVAASPATRVAHDLATEYFHQHAEKLYRYLSLVFGSRHDAEEVTQETFLRLYTALAAQEPIARPRAWVFTVARHLMINRRKHGRFEVEAASGAPDLAETICDPAPTPEDRLAERRRRLALRGALRDLTTLEQQCLTARAQGLKLREIGALVGLDLRRVAEVIDGAIQRLQRHLRD